MTIWGVKSMNILKRNKKIEEQPKIDIAQKISKDSYLSEVTEAKKKYEAAIKRTNDIVGMSDSLPNYVIPEGYKTFFENQGVFLGKIVKELPARIEIGELCGKKVVDKKLFCFDYAPVNVANLVYLHNLRHGQNQVEANSSLDYLVYQDHPNIERRNMNVLGIAIVADKNYKLKSGLPMTFLIASELNSGNLVTCLHNKSRSVSLEQLSENAKISLDNIYLISLNNIEECSVLKKL
jgi:hypothetical protein